MNSTERYSMTTPSHLMRQRCIEDVGSFLMSLWVGKVVPALSSPIPHSMGVGTSPSHDVGERLTRRAVQPGTTRELIPEVIPVTGPPGAHAPYSRQWTWPGGRRRGSQSPRLNGKGWVGKSNHALEPNWHGVSKWVRIIMWAGPTQHNLLCPQIIFYIHLSSLL